MNIQTSPGLRTFELFKIRQLGLFLMLLTGVVLTLGIAREVFLAIYGLETPLEDLRHFNFNTEHSLAAWFSSSLMLKAAVAAFCVARFPRISDRRQWTALAVIMLAFSVDESVSFHETLIRVFAPLSELSPIFYFSWVAVGIPLVLVVGAAFIPFLMRLPRRLSASLIVAGALFVSGAIGMEVIGGVVADRHGEDSVAYIMCYLIEDTLEMLGIIVFMITALTYLRDSMRHHDVGVRFG